MTIQIKPLHRNLMLGVAMASLAACGNVKDWDLRNLGGGFNTSDVGAQATMQRPTPDARGVISYPGYQVAIARPGDTVTAIADRLGLSPDAVAKFNAIDPNTPLTTGAVIALPSRVPSNVTPAPGTSPAGGGQIDITSLASGAIDRATSSGQGQQGQSGAAPGAIAGSAGTSAAIGSSTTSTGTAPQAGQNFPQPIRHRVQRGETAYSIARLYNIPVRALADWNGLGPDLKVHEGQVLLIPVTQKPQAAGAAGAAATNPPGQPTAVSEPPSAAQPLPSSTPPAASAAVTTPPSPDLGQSQTAASASKYLMPVQGKIIRGFSTKNPGIDISAPVGSPVRAAADGTIAAITQDTAHVPIVVVRQPGNYLTVYANVDNLRVKKGETVKRGQIIGEVRNGKPPFVHFEVRNGFQPLDPMVVLQ